jgi:hypothetical protein
VRRVAGLALAVALSAGPAFAQATPNPLLAELVRLCIGANGDRDAVETRALAAGYSATPASLLPNMRETDNAEGFLKSSEESLSMVVVGETSRRLGGETVQMKLCGVSSSPVDHRQLTLDVRATLDQEPLRGSDHLYAWVQSAAGRTPIRSTGESQLMDLIEAGGVRMIGVERRGKQSMLLYLVPTID